MQDRQINSHTEGVAIDIAFSAVLNQFNQKMTSNEVNV